MRIPVHGFRIVDTRVEEIEPRTMEEVVGHVKSPEFVWLDLDLQSAPVDQVKDLLLNKLDVHPLVVEECITPDVYQPKFDEESGYKFFIFHYFREGRQDYIKASELNIYMGENFVMTLHRSPIPTYLKLFAQNLPSDLFVFKDKAVIFLYHILDVLIDDQLKTLQLIQKRGDELEFNLLNPASYVPPLPLQGKRRLIKRRGKAQLELFKEILAQRHNLSLMRKSLLQELEILQEQVKHYEEPDEPLAITGEEREEVVVYLGGLVNHLEQAIQIVDQEREILSQLMDMHSTIIQARSEEIQRILTVYAALFIPLTFVASYFGMNLNILHGVNERYFIWGLDLFLLLMSAGIIFYFYKKDWL